MRLLLDTHAVAWWSEDSAKISNRVRLAIQDTGSEVFVSAISAYEMALKHRLGRWPEAANLLAQLDALLEHQNFAPLPLTIEHARRAGTLPTVHRDPFDRMLIAQALAEDMTLISNEAIFDQFGVRRLW